MFGLVFCWFFCFFWFFTKSEHYLRGMIFADVTGHDKEGLNLQCPVPSYTALEAHSPASAASASRFHSSTKSSSGIIFSAYFCLFLLLKISKAFLPNVILSCCCYMQCQ